MKDFVEVGDLFIIEGRRYHVRSIDSPRSVILDNGSEHLFTIGSGSVVWDEEKHGWVASGGCLRPFVREVGAGIRYYGDPIIEEEEPVVDGTPFFDTIDELDEILEDTNEQVDEDCLLYGHIWVRMGTVRKFYEPEKSYRRENKVADIIDWGPVKCLRCEEPAPEIKCDIHTYSTGALFCDRCGHPLGEAESWPPLPEKGFVAREGFTDRPGGEFEEEILPADGLMQYPVLPPPDPKLVSYVSGKDKPKHECGGCNLKDDVIAEYKRLLYIAVVWMPDNDHRREIMRFLRLSGKIRAWANEDKEEMDLMADMTQEED